MRDAGLVVAIVGATGAVGEEMRNVLAEHDFPVAKLKPLASPRSAGSTIEWRGRQHPVEVLADDSFHGVDLALFSAGTDVSLAHAPKAAAAGAIVVDNSRAFRMNPEVPLVVPEVNAHALDRHAGIIANPNCSTIQMVVALKPLHDLARIKRVVVSTYQSASGAGRKAMDELRDQTIALLNFAEPKINAFSRRLAFDTLPHIDRFEDDGFTREEHKMIFETRKIMGLPELPVCATCVRVPVFIGHACSVNVELERPVSIDEACEALAAVPGVDVRRDPAEFPTANDVVGQDGVFVGRVRRDPSVPAGLALWVVADNLRKGAATNAVQIAEALLARGAFA
ncbi:MAG: aspartate-semialdehyde dehydrogenase [Myxococcales bacterium]|nr:aspartate-semialdehyde dehydrogenase [Myxococcales bacterium]MCB9543076.1 aspartate-semialdehyde dehydrogenase [Myxococcales bacterium]MCB9551610.1 aspartate-semialdehyde dehydrogenase [Myxococcales bacterium]